jgi:hypothetical protein
MGDGLDVRHEDGEPSATPIRGRAPTARERGLRAVAEQLTPLQALTTIDQASARIVAAVSLIATLAGGVGLISASSLSEIGIAWAIPCVVAAALSVVAALIGTLPTRAKLAPGELDGLEAWFDHQISHRLLLIRTSAGLLVVAVLCAALPSVVAALSESQQELVVGLIATQNGMVRVDASASRLPDVATLQVILARGSRRLAFARQTPQSGDAGVRLQVCAGPGATVRVFVRALNDNHREGRQLSITVPGPSRARPGRCRPSHTTWHPRARWRP